LPRKSVALSKYKDHGFVRSERNRRESVKRRYSLETRVTSERKKRKSLPTKKSSSFGHASGLHSNKLVSAVLRQPVVKEANVHKSKAILGTKSKSVREHGSMQQFNQLFENNKEGESCCSHPDLILNSPIKEESAKHYDSKELQSIKNIALSCEDEKKSVSLSIDCVSLKLDEGVVFPNGDFKVSLKDRGYHSCGSASPPSETVEEDRSSHKLISNHIENSVQSENDAATETLRQNRLSTASEEYHERTGSSLDDLSPRQKDENPQKRR